MRRLWIASGLAGYLAAALFLTRPLYAEWTRAVPSHWEADVVHQLWLQWWLDQSLRRILSTMRTGYTASQGERLRERKRELEAQRRAQRC